MSHTIHNRDKLLARVRKLRGQVDSVERALTAGEPCSEVLHRIAACRGALGGLMMLMLEGHIREHVIDTEHAVTPEQQRAADEIVQVLRSYMK